MQLARPAARLGQCKVTFSQSPASRQPGPPIAPRVHTSSFRQTRTCQFPQSQTTVMRRTRPKHQVRRKWPSRSNRQAPRRTVLSHLNATSKRATTWLPSKPGSFLGCMQYSPGWYSTRFPLFISLAHGGLTTSQMVLKATSNSGHFVHSSISVWTVYVEEIRLDEHKMCSRSKSPLL